MFIIRKSWVHFLAAFWAVCILLTLSPGTLYAQLSIAELEDKVSVKREQIRDINVQIDRLTDFLNGFDAREQGVQDASDQLETLKAKLLDIEQKNLIKAMLVLGFETYCEIDGAVNLAKSSVENIAKHGMVWAVGSLGIDKISDSLKAKVGLDPSAYYAERTVSVSNFSEDALAQSVEVAKVMILLRRSLEDIDSQYYVDNGEYLGTRGSIFYKNQLVREQIDVALNALEVVLEDAASAQALAAADLEWCEGERTSLQNSLTAFEEQLSQARQDAHDEAVAEAIEELKEKQADFSPAPAMPGMIQGENESNHDFAVRQYYEAVGLIRLRENQVNQDIETLQTEYGALYNEASDYPPEISNLSSIVSIFSTPLIPNPDYYSLLSSITQEYAILKGHLENSTKGAPEIDSVRSEIEDLYDMAEQINDKRAELGNLDSLANSFPHPDTGPYRGGAYFTQAAQPHSYQEICVMEVGLAALEAARPEAQTNLRSAINLATEIFAAIDSAYVQTHNTQVSQTSNLENASTGVANARAALQLLNEGSVFCVFNDFSIRHVTYIYSPVQLNLAMATALSDHQTPDPVHAVWAAYQDYIAQYDAITQSHDYSMQMLLSTYQDFDSHPPVAYGDIQQTIQSGSDLQPSLTLTQLDEVSTRFQSASRSRFDRPTYLPLLGTEDPEEHPLYPLIAIKESIHEKRTTWPSMDRLDVIAERIALYDALYDWQYEPEYFLKRSPYSGARTAMETEVWDIWKEWEDRHSPPRITLNPTGGVLQPGQSMTLMVQADRYPQSFTWYVRDWLFGEWSVAGSGASLAVTYSDLPKQYYCHLVNTYGENYSMTVEVDPARAPEFASQPGNIEIAAGQPASLSAIIVGYGSYHNNAFQWYVSVGDDIAGPYLPIAGAISQQLSIPSVSGTRYYYLKVTSQFGSVDSDIVMASATGGEEVPVLAPVSDFTLYRDYPFIFQLIAAGADGFKISVPTEGAWLSLNEETGVLAGTPDATVTFNATFRAYMDGPSGRTYSADKEVTFTISQNTSNRPVLPEELYFNTSELQDPLLSGDFADYDRDGAVNLLEYFLGSSPKIANSFLEPALSVIKLGEETAITLQYPASAQRQGFAFVVEHSDDLVNWHPLETENAIYPGDGNTETIIYRSPQGSSDILYCRVRVYR